MEAVFQYSATAMAVDPSLRLRAVPCKKRPLSWYKPPTSPRDIRHQRSIAGSVSPVNLEHAVSPVNLDLSASPVNLGHSVSPVNMGHSVSPVNLTHSVNLSYSVCPTSPNRSVSPVNFCHVMSPANSPNSPVNLASSMNIVSPASPASSTSSHEDMVQARMSMSRSLVWPRTGAHARSPVTTGPSSTLTPFASTPRLPAVRKQSDFSIDHILRDAGTTRSTPASSLSSAPAHPEGHLEVEAHPEGHFEWLQCTRYRPPKLPRSRRRDGPAQRRLGRNPRIPFSPQQVAVLEARFFRSHYLSSADVAELSAQLELSETRVKIWFQNRRARERRDGDGRSTNSPPNNVAQTPQIGKPPAPSHLPRSTVSAFSVPKSQLIINDLQSNSFSTESSQSN